MIVCEIGNIPPHSVPVVIREIMAEQEDNKGFDDSSEESESIESIENSSNQFQEQENEDGGSSEEETVDKRV